MMIETLMFLAAAVVPVQSATDPAARAQSASQAVPSVDPAIIEMTYDAFVAVEETLGLSDLTRPAAAPARDDRTAIAIPIGTAWIS